MLLVDSHCHLNFPDFKDDLDAVIARAREAGVGVMQTICTELAEFDEVRGIAERYDHVYCSIGVHPNDSGKEEVVPAKELIERISSEKVIGIGETGLDYHYEHTNRDIQKRSFIEHIICAQETGLPIIVHSRDAEEDTAAILTYEYNKKSLTGVIHCFTSSQYLADKSLELGFYISFSGIISFKNAEQIREVAKKIPLDKILVETDAPYLAPIPHRGKRNEPSYVRFTNKILAELKNISEEECARATTDNFFRLFSKAKRPL